MCTGFEHFSCYSDIYHSRDNGILIAVLVSTKLKKERKKRKEIIQKSNHLAFFLEQKNWTTYDVTSQGEQPPLDPCCCCFFFNLKLSHLLLGAWEQRRFNPSARESLCFLFIAKIFTLSSLQGVKNNNGIVSIAKKQQSPLTLTTKFTRKKVTWPV